MATMQSIKNVLFAKYGKRCELCKKKFHTNKLTGHHIIMKSKGGDISEDNILILCYNCHIGVVNHIEYDSEEYWDLMRKCLAHRTSPP